MNRYIHTQAYNVHMVSTKTSKMEVQIADSRQVNEVRAASSKFPEIYSILTGNFSKNVFTYVNELFPSPVLQSYAVK